MPLQPPPPLPLLKNSLKFPKQLFAKEEPHLLR